MGAIKLDQKTDIYKQNILNFEKTSEAAFCLLWLKVIIKIYVIILFMIKQQLCLELTQQFTRCQTLFLLTLIHLILMTSPHDIGTIMISTLEIRDIEAQNVKQLTESHKAIQWWNLY